jgi:hypothetical protein
MSVKVVETTVNPVVVQSATAFNAEHARIWAEGTDPQVEKLGGTHSAKGWAEVASHLGTPEWGDIEGDIENQTDLMQALNGKQDTISDLSDIRSGAALGATAVQPGDLATVATTGAYNDLTGKPGVMTGADGTNPGTSGFVPAPTATDNEKFLRGDGTWAEAGSQGGGTWGTITGTLSDQTDLQNALNAKADNFTIGEGLEWQAGRVLTAPDHLPPNVFTKDNVTAGSDIEINQIIDPNVLNEDTLACFHLDGDTTNAVSTGVTLSDDFKSHITGYTDPLVNPWYPGRSAAIWSSPNTAAWCKLFSEDFDTFGTLEDYTLEFFLAASWANCWFEIKAIENDTEGATYPWITASYGGGENKYYVRCGADSSTVSNSPSFPFGTYSHIAIVRKNQVASIYVNGNLISQAANSLNFKNFAVRMEYETSPAAYLAEMVFSKIAKWDANFTPPTAPYHQQGGGNQYEIKSTVIEKHATNCLTEVPQHINLELSSGTLTLKAGSKAYKASGAEIAVSSDITAGYGLAVDGLFMVVNAAGTSVHLIQPENVSSGSTQPTVGDDKRYLWYDTTNNVVNMYAPNSSTAEEVSWPVAVVSSSGSNTFSSIDNVFNTFGYIGGTVFVLPGVKGYIPNGYNADGTLNNTPFETTAVLKANAGYNNHAEVYSITKNAVVVSQYYASQNDKPTTTGTLWYKPVENKMYRVQNDSSVVASDSCLVVRTVRDSSGKITTFDPVGVLRISENSGASSGLGGNDMPSKSYVDLTLGASGSSYTAPADGYVQIAATTSGTQYINIYTKVDDAAAESMNNMLLYQQITGASNYTLTPMIPVRAGQIFYVNYNASNVPLFRFIYTKASAPVN